MAEKEFKRLHVLLTLAGFAVGVAIAVLWLPPPQPQARPEPVVEAWTPPREPVPPGRRAIVLDAHGRPATFVDVYLTELGATRHRIYPAVRTNFEGHFHVAVPPGRYRVQGLFIDHEIEVPADPHPDIQVRTVPRPLLQFLSTGR